MCRHFFFDLLCDNLMRSCCSKRSQIGGLNCPGTGVCELFYAAAVSYSDWFRSRQCEFQTIPKKAQNIEATFSQLVLRFDPPIIRDNLSILLEVKQRPLFHLDKVHMIVPQRWLSRVQINYTQVAVGRQLFIFMSRYRYSAAIFCTSKIFKVFLQPETMAVSEHFRP